MAFNSLFCWQIIAPEALLLFLGYCAIKRINEGVFLQPGTFYQCFRSRVERVPGSGGVAGLQLFGPDGVSAFEFKVGLLNLFDLSAEPFVFSFHFDFPLEESECELETHFLIIDSG